MKKLVLIPVFTLLLMLSCTCSQKVDDQCYLYNIVSFSGIGSEIVRVKIDDGYQIGSIVDAKGEEIVFKTPVAALMYLYNEGWELVDSGNKVSGYGAIGTTTFWIIRKPCSKEEFEKAVQKGLHKGETL